MINRIGPTHLRFSSYCDSGYQTCIDRLVARIKSPDKTNETTEKVCRELGRMDVLISQGAESWTNYRPRNYATKLEVTE